MEDVKYFNSFLRDLDDLDTFQEFTQSKWRHQITPNVNHVPTSSELRKFNPLTDLTEQQFALAYRFSKDNMRRIIEIVRDDLETDLPSDSNVRSNQVPVELQIMAAIRCWGLSEHAEVTAAVHGVSAHTLAKICRRVSASLASKASRYIRMPATLAEKERVTTAFQQLACMPQVIGVVANCGLRLETEMRRDKACHTTEGYINIQIVSDAGFKIRDVDCRLRPLGESNGNCEIFKQSRIKERFEQNEFRGRVLLADEQLPSTPVLFTPVQCPASPAELAFNRSHAVTYQPAINCMRLWCKRFPILHSKISASYATARHTIVALALLHNMAIEWDDTSLASELKQTDEQQSNYFTNSGQPTDGQARMEFIKLNFSTIL